MAAQRKQTLYHYKPDFSGTNPLPEYKMSPEQILYQILSETNSLPL